MTNGDNLLDSLDDEEHDKLDRALSAAFSSIEATHYIEDGDTAELNTVIDRYRIIEQLGEGGFGVVYLAEQQKPINRRVALKVIKAGMDTRQVVARFEAERQALALMDHEYIANVFDAGATDRGRPYFVMELVQGVPITEFCEENKLDTNQRLRLLVSVCRAVQHAHQKGVIHRDLKPNNVLVTRKDNVAVPKIIDFGIAKATHGPLSKNSIFTRADQLIGTPAYMSPEQIAKGKIDVDTRSDVYSLGVLLYEILTGVTPVESKLLDKSDYIGMHQLICDTDPPPPSARLKRLSTTITNVAERRSADLKQLGAMLAGDLDWIAMKALDKDRSRRYESAGALADDIERYLNDEPVSAGPPTAQYRIVKFMRRHRKTMLAAAALTFVLVFATGFSLYLAIRANTAEKIAARERDIATHAHQKLVSAQQRRQVERVQSLLRTSPASVPVLVEELRAAHADVEPLLSQQLGAATRFEDKLRLAVARTLLGAPQLEILVDAVGRAPANEYANLLQSFRSARSESLPRLRQRIVETNDAQMRFRLAMLLLELGDPAAASEQLALKPDPTVRTSFIHGIKQWHGDLAAVADVLAANDSHELQSGLALGLGRLDPSNLTSDIRAELQNVLLRIHQTTSNGLVHNSSAWALKQWQVSLPKPKPTPLQTGHDWFVGAKGQKMMVIPIAGTDQTIPFAMADRETTVTMFREFLDDPNYSADLKPRDWPGIARNKVPSDDCPVHRVNIVDVILFCNWLSRAEDRQVCYEQDNVGQWWCEYEHDGYRLATVDEWMLACYGAVTTQYFFGDDAFLLSEYGNVLLRHAQPVASMMPNNHGLFDMFGNLWDACYSTKAIDWTKGSRHRAEQRYCLISGGTLGTGSYYLMRDTLFANSEERNPDVGFRVACSLVREE